MAIRARLITRKPVYPGVPRPEFQRYVWRFGKLYAEFVSAGLLHLIGRAPNVKNMKASIDFYTKDGLQELIMAAHRDGMTARHLTDVLINWPSHEDSTALPSYVDIDLHPRFVPLSQPDR